MSQIDVILPTYNQKEFLDRAIMGILDQEFKDFSFIIVEDGSSDGTEKILDQRYSDIDSRITIIYNGHNKGLPVSLNIGHANGKSPYCMWISTDNFSYKNQLRVLHEYITKNDWDFVQSSWRGILNGVGTVHNSSKGRGKGSFGFGNLGPSFLYRRKVWETYHYDENMMVLEDLKFYHQALLHPFKFGCIEECLMDYYNQPNSLTVHGNPKRRYQDMMNEVYRTIIVPYLEKQKSS